MTKDTSLVFSLTMILCATKPIDVFSQPENNPPVIKIIEPLNKSIYTLNAQLHFRIKVSDQEDGESEYNEIAANEVFLEVRYIPDVSKASSFISTADPVGLMSIKKSNCFNCHAFNGKLIAPSFYEIANRYAPNAVTIELLAKRIREGSGGVWGNASMPSHDELTIRQAHEIADWILENGKDLDLNYYTGLEGIVKTKTSDGTNHKGSLILSATYSDHGSKNNLQQNLSSKDVIILSIK